MTITLANHKDAQHIALLARETFSETFGHLFRDRQDLLNYLDKTFNVTKIEESLSKPNNIFWIAFVKRLPVGYAKVKLHSISSFIDNDNVCQLQKIYVLKDFLSHKTGFQMQSLLVEKAKELDFDMIWLSVLRTNERAVKFYERNSFKTIGSHNFSIGKEDFDFIAMSRHLK